MHVATSTTFQDPVRYRSEDCRLDDDADCEVGMRNLRNFLFSRIQVPKVKTRLKKVSQIPKYVLDGWLKIP